MNATPSPNIPDGWSVQGTPASYGEIAKGHNVSDPRRNGNDDKQAPTDYPSEDYGAQ